MKWIYYSVSALGVTSPRYVLGQSDLNGYWQYSVPNEGTTYDLLTEKGNTVSAVNLDHN